MQAEKTAAHQCMGSGIYPLGSVGGGIHGITGKGSGSWVENLVIKMGPK